MSLFDWIIKINNRKADKLEELMILDNLNSDLDEFHKKVMSESWFTVHIKQQEKEMNESLEYNPLAQEIECKLTVADILRIHDMCTAIRLTQDEPRICNISEKIDNWTKKVLSNQLTCNIPKQQASPTYEPTQTDKWDKFFDSVKKMNETYELPVANLPTLLPNQAIRTQQFLDIMRKELSEGDEELFTLQSQFAFTEEDRLNTLTHLADWYGDMIVYITSEAIRNGIPIMEVLEIIMASNMTKLGEDGKPIKDENDKFQKGPNFIPPESAIKETLKHKINQPKGNN